MNEFHSEDQSIHLDQHIKMCTVYHQFQATDKRHFLFNMHQTDCLLFSEITYGAPFGREEVLM